MPGNKKDYLVSYSFLMPVILMILVIIFIPMVSSFLTSFTEWNGASKPQITGISNYIDILLKNKLFFKSLSNSLKLTLISSVLSVTIGYFLAEALITISRKRLSEFYRLVFFIPAMLPLAVVGILFKFIYNPTYGLLNNLLQLLHLNGLTHSWLGEANLAIYSIIAVNIWKTFGLNMIIFYAGLKAIPKELYEAASIDGAGKLKKMFFISIPLLRPVIELAIVISTILGLKTFDIVYVMTGGGPGRATITVPILIVENSFRYNKFGYGAAIGMVLFVVTLLIIYVIRKFIGTKEKIEF
ncbi:MAG: sugar ABC transporter permease [Actinomycetota bacterium]|nr:sugar ABC transporter permease [Actinomycetota bacterium]